MTNVTDVSAAAGFMPGHGNPAVQACTPITPRLSPTAFPGVAATLVPGVGANLQWQAGPADGRTGPFTTLSKGI